MCPSAKELGLGVGDVGTLHLEGSDKLNDCYNLGAKEGDKILIVEPGRTGCWAKNGRLVGRLAKTGVDFVLPPDWDLFLKI